ncbi:hypothetical protein Salat_2057700 [Sesamum alatum]|uniref:Protein TIFY n=1 Tax=Sesamum alatum TaxID=300844 RepID=A0AAE1Y046_9LAMI|nr:hypothetical protein Salat_2057700 [Sesamum alatum]
MGNYRVEDGSRNYEKQPQQQLTIFYNGRVVVCDATEFQARAILLLASREAAAEKRRDSPGSEPSSPVGIYSPTAGVSMKGSLKRFLQKRRNRAQSATSPYPPIINHSHHQN